MIKSFLLLIRSVDVDPIGPKNTAGKAYATQSKDVAIDETVFSKILNRSEKFIIFIVIWERICEAHKYLKYLFLKTSEYNLNINCYFTTTKNILPS